MEAATEVPFPGALRARMSETRVAPSANLMADSAGVSYPCFGWWG